MTTTEVRETEFSQNCFEVLVKAQEQNNTLLTYATNMKVIREPLPKTSWLLVVKHAMRHLIPEKILGNIALNNMKVDNNKTKDLVV